MEKEGNKSRQQNHLPRIYSQKRVRTAQRKNTEQDKALTNRPLSNNGRTKSMKNFTSKTVKYQATGTMYNKKVEDIEKQNFLIERQMKQVQNEIQILRATLSKLKKEPTSSRLNQSHSSFQSRLTVKKFNLNDPNSVKTQLKNLQTKILTNRNKIDTHLQKNKAIQKEIDAYRKQISTLKTINQQLQTSFKKTTTKYQQEIQLSKRLDTQIGQKTELIHKKKVQNMHQKANLIKQYDTILKTLDKQLNQEKQQQTLNAGQSKVSFYLTDPAMIGKQSVTIKPQQKRQERISQVKKPKINIIRDKLKQYEQQFQQLKQKIGSSNIQQITQKFTSEYQNNFHQYTYINKIYEQLQQLNIQQFELTSRKVDLLRQIQTTKPECKVRQINSIHQKINRIHLTKQHLKQEINLFNNTTLQLKLILKEYFSTSSLQSAQLLKDLTQQNISKLLYTIFQENIAQFNALNQTPKNTMIKSTRSNIDEILEQTKRENENLKDAKDNGKLLTRQEIVQSMKEKSSRNNMKFKKQGIIPKQRSHQNNFQYKK